MKYIKEFESSNTPKYIIAQHITQKYDDNGHEYNNSEFYDGLFGNRIFKTTNTMVMPIWFSELNWQYASGVEYKKITCKLHIEKTFNPLSNDKNILEKYAILKYGNKYDNLAEYISDGDWESIENGYDNTIPALIKELGYDSYISFENDKKSYAVFDKKNIEILDIT